MRTTLLAAAGLGLAVTFLPAAPASAYCYDLGEFGCVNPCYGIEATYHDLDRTAGDALPDQPFHCLD